MERSSRLVTVTQYASGYRLGRNVSRIRDTVIKDHVKGRVKLKEWGKRENEHSASASRHITMMITSHSHAP